MDLFQVFSSTQAYQPSSRLRPLVPSSPPTPAPSLSQSKRPTSKTIHPLYAIVKHDFKPQRKDELDARKGEAIIIIAHSYQEWFVAKPIGRLGGPGLIPISFVQVKDLVTGKGLRPDAVQSLIHNSIIPDVEQWKRAAAAYKGNSIPLGNIDPIPTTRSQSFKPTTTKMTATPTPLSLPATIRKGSSKSHQDLNRHFSATSPPESRPPRPARSTLFSAPPPPEISTEPALPTPPEEHIKPDRRSTGPGTGGFATVDELRQRYGILTGASLESFHKDQSQYWFHLRARFTRPSNDSPSGEQETVLLLYRVYEQFFEFHARLLEAFPDEAGLHSIGDPNIFPSLPEPKDDLDQKAFEERMAGLAKYLEKLSKLPGDVLESEFIYEFLGPREGDVNWKEFSDREGRPTSVDSSSSRNGEVQRGDKTHRSNFSASTTASVDRPHELGHRIKVYQQDSPDVIVLRFRPTGGGRRELMEKVEERIRALRGDGQMSTLLVRGTEDWAQLESDEQMERWMNGDRLAVMYVPATS